MIGLGLSIPQVALMTVRSVSFSVSQLFAAGEQGLWYDPSDFSTMFQDSLGTTPVTAVGQPVGKILDKSGRGNHATQATAAARPTLQQDAGGKYYLNFDGVDDSLATAAINFSATDKMTTWSGVRPLSTTLNAYICSLSATPVSTTGTFGLRLSSATSFQTLLNGSSLSAGSGTISSVPSTNVLTHIMNIGAAVGAENGIRVNGGAAAYSSGNAGTGNFINAALYINTTANFNMALYSLIVRGAASTAPEITNTETYVNSKTGAWA